ncbi:putative tetratricopeptide TPR_2 [Treponema primitia ZAS-2]|uniref:Putative tetratricopeptide TPR_2 n=1 Tax=Treponema primitia (strain ATCC BAA-887 / DSM 12427 / ZAS-2) TaxID=545694 RepID=F5YHA1_TREPZ|nr:tetratricopeptide repeat protein [Treponema primitia]AEF84651.1 putative tetratricopeptide TPR_2 [Treponema primitia ZAS-2]
MSTQDVQDLTKRARMFIRDGRYKEATETLNTALETDPEFIAAHNLRGIAYGKLREWKKSLAAFRKGLTLDRNSPTLHLNYGIALEARGQPQRAPSHYRSAIRNNPEWIDALNALGIVQFKQEVYNSANRTFSRVLKVDPDNAEALNNKGVVLADQGRHKEAIKKYRAALEKDSRYIKAALNLARALEDTGNFPGALEELERLADMAPTDWDVRTRLAGLYQKLERYDDAMDQASAVLEKDPENIQAMRIAGSVQGIQGNDEEAKNIFEKITTLDPAAETGDTYTKFMLEDPESRYCLDLIPATPAPPKPAPGKRGSGKAAKASASKSPAAKAGSAEPVSKTVPVEPSPPAAEIEAVAEVEPVAETETVEEVEAAAEAELVIEVEPAVEAETIAEIEAVEEVEAVAEAEIVAETETAAEVEAVAEIEPVEEVEAAAGAEIVAETEAVAEIEPIEEVEPVEENETAAVSLSFAGSPEPDLLGLMRYLMVLTESLPESALNEFMHSDAHMELKFIIDTLENPNG